MCVNTEGSYRCDCADKYKRNDADTACVGEPFVNDNNNNDDGDSSAGTTTANDNDHKY